MSAARIGKVRLKKGGAELRILDRKSNDPGGENWRGKIMAHARSVASYEENGSELVGFLVIGFFSDGAHSLGWRWDANRSPIPRRLLPAYVADLIREDLITGPALDERLG